MDASWQIYKVVRATQRFLSAKFKIRTVNWSLRKSHCNLLANVTSPCQKQIEADHFLEHKSVQRGYRDSTRNQSKTCIHYQPTETFSIRTFTRVTHQAWRKASLKEKRSGLSGLIRFKPLLRKISKRLLFLAPTPPSWRLSSRKRHSQVFILNGTLSLLRPKYKINLIRPLTCLWYQICSSSSLLQSTLDDLRKLVLQNGYS